MLMACSPHSVREAQLVVADADSLWHNGQLYGIDYGDSATLAQAYETFGKISTVNYQLSTDFSHSCYHYGRLLREKDNPVEAMQAFIAATHSRTRDYHILGRVYSNIGDICHLAGEFQLSYDMFERSADMFLQNGDSLLYYYDLNNMAFEKALLGDTLVVFSLLENISGRCTDNAILKKTLETKAELHMRIQQYDSALFYISELCANCDYYPMVNLMKAQIYSYQGIKDSATHYAEQVIRFSVDISDIHNALYILTNDDESKSKESIRQLASDRADIQMILKDRQGKLSQAVQLLEQDLNRKPDLRWLYAILATLLIIGTSTGIYAYRKYNKRELLSQQVNDLLNKNDAEIQRHEQIIQEHEEYNNSLAIQIEKYCIILSQAEDFPNNIYWKDFDAMSKLINDNFGMLVTKLQSIYHLSEREIRLCILVMMCDPSGTELANLLYYGKGIRTFKNRVAHKLGTNSTELHVFLIKLAANIYSE